MRSFTFAALLTLAFAQDSWAAPARSVKDLAAKVQSSKQQVIEADAEKRRILGSLFSIQQRMKKIIQEKGHLTDELIHAQENAREIAKVIASLEEEIAKQRVQLRRRLRAVYKLSGEGYVGIIFSQRSPADLDETLRFMKVITENDYRLIQNYQTNIATYKAHRTKLDAQVQRLVGIEKKIKTQESLLAKEHKSKSKFVSELDRKRAQEVARIKTLRKKGEAIVEDTEISELLKPSIFEFKGQLASPVTGDVVQEFGVIEDHKYKIRLSHKGWAFSGMPSAAVTSIFDGVVARAESIPGYGSTVLIDHGDHYYSIYSHLGKTRVSRGDQVKRGQSLGEVGSAKGIYFEIRHFSEPENPANWIQAKSFRISPSSSSSEGRSSASLSGPDSQSVH